MNDILNENLISHMENISRAAAGSGLEAEKFSEVVTDIEALGTFLDVTSPQAVLFSVLADLSLQKTVTLDVLAKYLNCSVLTLLSKMSESEALEKKGYVKKSLRRRSRRPSYNDNGYTVPASVMEAIVSEDRSKLTAEIKMDLLSFLKQVSGLVDERSDGTLTTAQVCDEISFLISNNTEIPYVFFVDSALDSIISKCTMFTFSYIRLRGQLSVDYESYANAFFDDLSEQLEFCQDMASGRHELYTGDLLKPVPSMFEGDKSVSLTFRAAKELYRSYPALLKPEAAYSSLTSYKTLREKKLCFGSDMMAQVKTMEEMLNRSNFRAYCRQLERNSLPGGVTVMFYGAPGTGKTELVYQLARKTKRDIMMVDLSQTRNKYFGESEKKVKQIFDDYAAILKNADTEPFLFINEADGLLTKRIDLSINNESSDRVTNMMQNIMLQALENFRGILIATTNLTGNLDKAFERRFTYRVNFPNPDSHVRGLIWKNKLPELTDSEAATLGAMFGISGGEIDNQVRQALLRKVLRKKVGLFESLVESCTNTHGFTIKKKVGF